MSAVQARRTLHAVQAPNETHHRARRPVVTGPEVGAGGRHAAGIIPVPGADHRLRRGDLQGLLHRGLVDDRLAEIQDDGHAHPVGLAVPLEDLGLEGSARRQGTERAQAGDGAATRSGRPRGHRVGLGDIQRPLAAPHRAPRAEQARYGIARRSHSDVAQRAVGCRDRNARRRIGIGGPVRRRDRHVRADRRGGRGLFHSLGVGRDPSLGGSVPAARTRRHQQGQHRHRSNARRPPHQPGRPPIAAPDPHPPHGPPD